MDRQGKGSDDLKAMKKTLRKPMLQIVFAGCSKPQETGKAMPQIGYKAYEKQGANLSMESFLEPVSIG